MKKVNQRFHTNEATFNEKLDGGMCNHYAGMKTIVGRWATALCNPASINNLEVYGLTVQLIVIGSVRLPPCPRSPFRSHSAPYPPRFAT